MDVRITVRFPEPLAQQLRREAERQRLDVSALIRDYVARGLRERTEQAAYAPLVEALHLVLPAYLDPLVSAVVATRFDAIVARELAQGAALASLLAQPAMTPERARELVTNTLGQAIKVAKKRVREIPELILAKKDGDP